MLQLPVVGRRGHDQGYRNGDQDNGVSVEDAIARVVDAVQRRIQV